MRAFGRRGAAAAAGAAVALALAGGSAWAAQLALTPAELYAAADLVVLAEPTSREVRWAAGDQGAIETVVWLAPGRSWRGTPPDTLELVLPGGTIGEHGTHVEDVPTLELDRPYVLCLVQTPNGWEILGGEQGVFAVEDGANPGWTVPEITGAMGVTP